VGKFRLLIYRSKSAAVSVALSLAAIGIYGVSLISPVPAQASNPAPLMPSAGQYFPVSPVKAADTRDGTGGVSSVPLAGGGTISFPVLGIGQVPAGGVSDVFVMITAQSPSADGCLHDYSSDVTDPAICTVSYQAGVSFTNSDILAVGSAGTVSVTNASSGSTHVVVWVLGYYQDDSARRQARHMYRSPRHRSWTHARGSVLLMHRSRRAEA
jgi:hypothetical protein